MENMGDLVEIRLPKNVVDRVEKLVNQHDGLFENTEDYITHAVIHFNRRKIF